MNEFLRTETISNGKYSLLHERETFFPPGHAFPYFAYNWFTDETNPFWNSGAHYKYSIIKSIPNILVWDKNQNLGQQFKEMYNSFTLVKPEDGLDYAVAAFAIQVLEYNGVIVYNESQETEFIILSPKINKHLSLISLTSDIGTCQHIGYIDSKTPYGQGMPPENVLGKWFFTDKEIHQIQKQIEQQEVALSYINLNTTCITEKDKMQEKDIGKLPKHSFFQNHPDQQIYQAINNKWYFTETGAKLREEEIFGTIWFKSQSEVYKQLSNGSWKRI